MAKDDEPPVPPHPGRLMAIIRRLALSGALGFTEHAQDRMEERDIDAMDVLIVLKTGEIDGPVEPGENSGEWHCQIIGSLPSTSREVGVVTLVVRETRLLIVTTYWKDP